MRTLTIGDQALLAPKAPPPPSIADTAGVWWAGDLALADGDPIGTWTDRVNAVSVTNTGTARPTFDADGANGRPSVNFDGGDWLGVDSALSTAQSGCVVAVARIDDPLQGQSLWSHGGSNTNRYLLGTTRFSTGGQIESQQRNSDWNDVVWGSTSVPATTLVALEWASSSTAYAHRYNNNTQSMTVTAGSNNGDWFGDVGSADRWTIGGLRYNTPIGLLAGRIAFLGVYNAPLSTGDRAALYSWIGTHYGITVA